MSLSLLHTQVFPHGVVASAPDQHAAPSNSMFSKVREAQEHLYAAAKERASATNDAIRRGADSIKDGIANAEQGSGANRLHDSTAVAADKAHGAATSLADTAAAVYTHAKVGAVSRLVSVMRHFVTSYNTALSAASCGTHCQLLVHHYIGDNCADYWWCWC
jgi:hypothetical protein